MPNWCEGSLKLKGKYEDIMRFWDEGINAYSYQVGADKPGGTELVLKENWTDIEEYDGYDIISNRLPVKQAWGINQSDWIELAEKYHLEIKLFAIECGMGFWCTFHVLPDGAILDNNFHQSEDYKDFVWNCPFPWVGG